MDIKTIYVAGAGAMGSGIAQTAAASGFQVMLTDLNSQLVDKAISKIQAAWAKNVEKGKKRAKLPIANRGTSVIP